MMLTIKEIALPFDVARRAVLIVGVDASSVSPREWCVLLPVAERTKKLFGDSGAEGAADSTETDPGGMQRSLFPELEVVPKPLRPRAGWAHRP